MTKQYLKSFKKPLLALALLGSTAATAQDLHMPATAPPSEVMEIIPPGDPGMQQQSVVSGVDDALAPGHLDAGPDPIAAEGFDSYNGYGALEASTNDLWGCRPAFTESTGTWLRRGWWYTELDAVVLNRQWKRDDMRLGVDNSSTRGLNLNRTDPGASASVRLTLGRFLFRDIRNRDHTLEFTAFGGGESSQDDTMTSSTGGQTLFVPTGISDFNPAFDGADSMAVNYDSRFSSFELNYRVKERMGRDRMMLTPGGDWVRTANEGITKQYLVGLRYMDMVDVVDWNATNIATFAGEDGNYHIDTNNDMFGLQLGCSLLMEHDRWNLELMGKGGPFINDAKAASALSITNDDDSSFRVNNRESSLAFVGEFQLIGRYHLRPNVSLRAGWQMMYITSVALGPDQMNFSPDEGRFPYTGDPFYNGGIFGLETYW